MRGRLKVEGLKEAIDRVDKVGLRARRPEPALRSQQTFRDLRASEERRFATTRGWARDTPAWIAEKRRRGLDPRTLHAKGNLERALTSGRGITFRAFNGVLSWGIPTGRSDLFYAQPLAAGYPTSRGRVKPRRMVVIDKTARGRIALRVQRYVATGEVA